MKKRPFSFSAFSAFSYLLSVAALVALIGSCVACRHSLQPPDGARPPRAGVTPVETEQHVYAGVPRSRQRLTVLANPGFSVGYDESRRCPAWTAYVVVGPPVHPTMERPSRFDADPRTRARVDHDDYTHSGYDRGHMAPNYAMYSRYGRDAQVASFLMSNICPQDPGLNREAWRELEARVAGDGPRSRSWAAACKTLWVVTGPVFDEQETYLKSGVEIPDAFYKVIMDVDEKDGTLRALAFLFPNRDEERPLSAYLVSIDQIELLTGLDFFWRLEDRLEDALESERARALWQ